MHPTAPATAFQPYLLTGERVLWTGRPKQGLVLHASDALLIPFSLLWTAFAIVWNLAVWLTPEADEIDLPFKLFGLFFVAIGLYFVFGRFIHDSAMRRKIAYAVTDQRVLVLRGSRFTSLDLRRLPKLELSEHRDGTGTITFEGGSLFGNYWRYGGMDFWLPSLSASTQLFRIEDPRRVYQLIRENSDR